MNELKKAAEKLEGADPGKTAADGLKPHVDGHDFLIDHETYRFLRHPITMVISMGKGGLIMLPFILLVLFVTSSFATPVEQMFLLGSLVLGFGFVFVNAYIQWIMNVAILDSKQLRVYIFKSIVSHNRESINVARINTFDLKKDGFLPYFFNMGDIELASIISDDENNSSLSITQIWKAEEKVALVKKMSYRSQNS